MSSISWWLRESAGCRLPTRSVSPARRLGKPSSGGRRASYDNGDCPVVSVRQVCIDLFDLEQNPRSPDPACSTHLLLSPSPDHVVASSGCSRAEPPRSLRWP